MSARIETEVASSSSASAPTAWPGWRRRRGPNWPGPQSFTDRARQLDLLDDSVAAVRRAWPSPMLPALRTLLDDADGDVHVVASGDPLLHGVGSSADPAVRRPIGCGAAARVVGDAGVRAGRLGGAGHRGDQPGHRRAAHRGAPRRPGRRAVPGRHRRPAALARLLDRHRPRRLRDRPCSNSSAAPAERRRDGHRPRVGRPTAGRRRRAQRGGRALPARRTACSQVLPDDAFAHDGQITKQSIRAVTLAALAPRPGELLWDVGAGSGSIAIEWCRSGRVARRWRSSATSSGASGSPRTPWRSACTSRCARRRAREPFDGVAAPVGDLHRRRPHASRDCWTPAWSGCRSAAGWSPTRSPSESEAVLAQWYSRLGGELRRFQHYRGEPVGRFTGWRPAMPVTQWLVTKP